MSLSGLMEWCLEHLNYWVVFVLMVLENSVVPLPSELIVTPAAYKAANGEMSILLVIFITTLGSTIGAVINYYIALAVGRPLVYRFANSRLGHLLFINRQRIEYVEALFLKHGKISIFFGRLLPAGRQFISIPAGLTRMKLSSFILYTFLGSAIWNSILVLLGYYLAQVLPEEKVIGELQRHSMEFSLAFIGLIGFIIGFYYLRNKES